MLEYFNQYQVGQYRGLRQYPKLNIVNKIVNGNLQTVLKYHRRVNYHSIKTINVLTDLIFQLSEHIEYDDFNFYQHINEKALNMSHKLGLTTIRGPGKSFKDILYKNSTSYIIYTSKLVDLNKIKERWRYYIPLRLIYNQDHDIDYEARDGYKDLNHGVCFFELDVVRMLMMYKYWFKFRRSLDLPPVPSIFITQFVYPNMLLESLNLNLFNRFITYVKNGVDYKIDVSKQKYPFYLMHIEDPLDKELKDYFSQYQNSKTQLGRLINSLPVFSILKNRPNEMLAFLRTRVPSKIRQTSWFLWYSRLPYIRYLLEFLGEEGLKYNIGFFRSFQREFLLYRSNGILRMKDMPEHFQAEVDDHMDYILTNILPNLK